MPPLKGMAGSEIDPATLPRNEMPLRRKYRGGGIWRESGPCPVSQYPRSKKSKQPTSGNSGAGGAKREIPRGMPRHYRGRTKVK